MSDTTIAILDWYASLWLWLPVVALCTMTIAGIAMTMANFIKWWAARGRARKRP